MLLNLIEYTLLSQSLFWALLHSFWQTAILWLLYRTVVHFSPNSTSNFKYNIAIFSTLLAFIWFIKTGIEQYYLLSYHPFEISLGISHLPQQFWVNFQKIVTSLYLATTLFFLIKLWRMQYLANSIYKTDLIKAPSEIRIFVSEMINRYSIHKSVTVWLSDKISSPAVIGFMKPIILLPIASINYLTQTQLESILLHEIIHIKKNDYIWNICCKTIQAILFFNPFIKLFAKEIEKEREYQCDDEVVNHPYTKLEYAKALYTIEKNRLPGIEISLAVKATNGEKPLLARIQRIFLENEMKKGSYSTKIFHQTAITLAFLSLLLVITPALVVKQPNAYKLNGKNWIIAFDKKASILKEKPSFLTNNVTKSTKKSQNHSFLEISKSVPNSNTDVIYINERYLNPPQAPVNVLVSDIIPNPDNRVMVTIEEENSGSDQNKVYLFEIERGNNSTEIKPLIMMKKTTPPIDSLQITEERITL